jgi:predicted negative regulator of RcsB-dependent stress response
LPGELFLGIIDSSDQETERNEMSTTLIAHLRAVRSFHIAKGDLLLEAGENRAAADQYEQAIKVQ